MKENNEGKKTVEKFPSVVDMRRHTVPNVGMTCLDKGKKLVNARHVTKIESGEHVALEHQIDLSDFSEEKILENAAMNVLIGNRAGIKGLSLKEVLDRFKPGYVWKPAPAERKADPMKKVSTGIQKLDFSQTVSFLMATFGMDEKTAKATAIKKFQPEEK